MEKQPDTYAVDGHESPDYEEINKQEARRGSKVNEATDMYGDVATAEEYGYVSRGYVQFNSTVRKSVPDDYPVSSRVTFNLSLLVVLLEPVSSWVSAVLSPTLARSPSSSATL